MKKKYSLFGSILTTLLMLDIILTILMGIYYKFIFRCTSWGLRLDETGMPINFPSPPWHQNLAASVVKFIPIFALITFILNLVYVIVGSISYLFTRFRQKEKRKDGSAKIMVLNGAIGMATVYILYFIVQLLGALYGLCL